MNRRSVYMIDQKDALKRVQRRAFFNQCLEGLIVVTMLGFCAYVAAA